MRKWMILLLLGIFMNVRAQSGANILIWDHDEGSSFFSETTGQYEGCQTALERVLKGLGHEITVIDSLPDNLDAYDAVFITLGFYCPG